MSQNSVKYDFLGFLEFPNIFQDFLGTFLGFPTIFQHSRKHKNVFTKIHKKTNKDQIKLVLGLEEGCFIVGGEIQYDGNKMWEYLWRLL